MDFAEVQFIFAEAALKGLITEGLLLLKLLWIRSQGLDGKMVGAGSFFRNSRVNFCKRH
jgi:hypothetical protein